MPLLGSEVTYVNCLQFCPDGSWLASGHRGTVIFWSMAGARSTVVGRQKPPVVNVAFTPDGHLLSSSPEGVVRRWPLSPGAADDVQELWSHPEAQNIDQVDPGGRFPVAGLSMSNEIPVVPLDGSPPRIHRLRKPEGMEPFTQSVSLDPGGRLLAAFVVVHGHPDLSAIRIVDLATGDERALDTHPEGEERRQVVGSDREGWAAPVWLRDGRLVSDGDAGLRVWNLEAGTNEQLRPCRTTE